ncbi:MAG: DUF2073 domain-containing protein [Methanolinea sp.]|nr:DUF2073 domain-containing protein [Methanolinea sp.]
MTQGVRIDLISSEKLEKLTSMEKVHLILDHVRQGTIIILEKGLSPEEQSTLIEMTMREIFPDGFNGIEIETYPSREESPGFLKRILGMTPHESRLTVIGPANQLRLIRKEKDVLSAWVSTR